MKALWECDHNNTRKCVPCASGREFSQSLDKNLSKVLVRGDKFFFFFFFNLPGSLKLLLTAWQQLVHAVDQKSFLFLFPSLRLEVE